MKLQNMVSNSSLENNPISKVRNFLDEQEMYKGSKDIEKWRFVGYVLELNYESAKIITNDTYKMMVGGIPRGSFLMLVPSNYKENPSHFTLVRVRGITSTPLTMQVQQTYFEMHKRSMPELDLWTQSDLQWGALECDVLGMFYPNPNNSDKVSFSGDVNNVVSAHRYEVYSPSEELLKLIVNGTVKEELRHEIGHLRTMECLFEMDKQKIKNVPVEISIKDFMGCRTAMFGKTRLGKSNVVKLIVQSIIDATKEKKNVGQLIFDINGEYANGNEKNVSIYSQNMESCEIYALNQRTETPSKQLKLNFYENFSTCKNILGTFLKGDNRNSIYIEDFISVNLPDIEEIKKMDTGDKIRAIRRVQMYWAVLKEAGFDVNENTLKKLDLNSGKIRVLMPNFSEELRDKVYGNNKPDQPSTLSEIKDELIKFIDYQTEHGALKSSSKKDLFDKDDLAILGFLKPRSGSAGPKMLSKYKIYHSSTATDFINEIISYLQQGKTVILDLGNANESVRKYFSDLLSREVFRVQEDKFVNNELGENYIQLYFEEAHNLFPPESKDLTDIYSRFAKEGAKFHIGMVYSTQSPSTINKELLIQTENFFVGHLSSSDETRSLTRMQIAFSGIEEDILRSKTPGYMRMLTLSHRFVVPVQTKEYKAKEV